MAKNSAIDHDTAVEVLNFFNNRTEKINRKARKHLGKPLNVDSQRRMVQAVDREIQAKYGFPMRALWVK